MDEVPSRMAEQWSPSFRYVMLGVVVVGLVALLGYLREMIIPLVISALLAYVMHPLVGVFHTRFRLSEHLSVTLVFWLSFLGLVSVPAVLVPVLINQVQTLALDFDQIVGRLDEFFSSNLVIFGWSFPLEQLVPDFANITGASVTALAESALYVLELASKNFAWSLVILVATYYFLKDWPYLRDGLIGLAPEAYQPDIRRLHTQIKEVWAAYMRGQLALMFIVGVIFSIVWIAIGLPGALLLGIITGLFSLVPELGPAVAALLAILVAFFEGSLFLPLSPFWFALLVLALYLVLINFKNIWLRPRIMGRSVHMHEGVVFIAIVVAVVVQGVLGALIVIPVLASVSIILGYIHRRILGLPPFIEGVENPLVKTEPPPGKGGGGGSEEIPEV